MTLLYWQSTKWCRLNYSALDTESDLAIIGYMSLRYPLLQMGKQKVYIFVWRARGHEEISPVEEMVKCAKRWRTWRGWSSAVCLLIYL